MSDQRMTPEEAAIASEAAATTIRAEQKEVALRELALKLEQSAEREAKVQMHLSRFYEKALPDAIARGERSCVLGTTDETVAARVQEILRSAGFTVNVVKDWDDDYGFRWYWYVLVKW